MNYVVKIDKAVKLSSFMLPQTKKERDFDVEDLRTNAWMEIQSAWLFILGRSKNQGRFFQLGENDGVCERLEEK